MVKGAGKEKKTTFDPVRTRIARRAALEFKTGMYGKTIKMNKLLIKLYEVIRFYFI